MKLNNILILHGWNSGSNEHWFMKAKEMFEALGFNVFLPELPGNYYPKKKEWE